MSNNEIVNDAVKAAVDVLFKRLSTVGVDVMKWKQQAAAGIVVELEAVVMDSLEDWIENFEPDAYSMLEPEGDTRNPGLRKLRDNDAWEE